MMAARRSWLVLFVLGVGCGGGDAAGGDGGAGDGDGAQRDGAAGGDAAGGAPTLADLWAGRAHFVLDQPAIPVPTVPEGGPTFGGHREVFAVARPDLGANVVLYYQRCFEPGRGASPGICLARSDDNGATMGTYLGIIISPEAHGVTPCSNGAGELFAVAPSVARVGGQWVLTYEAGGVTACWASSPDGIAWTKQGWVEVEPVYYGTPGVIVVDDELLLYTGYHRTADGLQVHLKRGASVEALVSHGVVFAGVEPWEAGSTSMPRVVEQGGTYYMSYEGATLNLRCGEGAGEQNVYGIGIARSTDLVTWEPFAGNPVLQSADTQSCGNDMPQPFLSPYDGVYYLYHPNDIADATQRERLDWGGACGPDQPPPLHREKNHACLPSCASLGGTCEQTKDCSAGVPLGESWDCAACCGS